MNTPNSHGRPLTSGMNLILQGLDLVKENHLHTDGGYDYDILAFQRRNIWIKRLLNFV